MKAKPKPQPKPQPKKEITYKYNNLESMPYTINYHDWDYDEMETVNISDINPSLLNKIKQLPKFKLYNIHQCEIFKLERVLIITLPILFD